MDDVEIVVFPVAPLDANCALIRCRQSGEAIIIDPGGEGDRIRELLAERDARLRYILLTHAHFDHCQGMGELAQLTRQEGEDEPVIAVHPDDREVYAHLEDQCRMFGFPPVSPAQIINHDLADGEVIEFGSVHLEVLHVPGHSPGSCCFLLEQAGVIFSGDTLFYRGIGRGDLPGGDPELLIQGIRNRLYTLDEKLRVIPGHGPLTSIREEKLMNPYVRL